MSFDHDYLGDDSPVFYSVPSPFDSFQMRDSDYFYEWPDEPSASYELAEQNTCWTDVVPGDSGEDVEQTTHVQAETPQRRMDACRLCARLVPQNLHLRHVRQFHSKRVRFRCRHCAFFSTYSCSNVRQHMAVMHQSRYQPLTLRRRDDECLLPFLYLCVLSTDCASAASLSRHCDGAAFRCFGDARFLRQFPDAVVSTVFDLVETVACCESDFFVPLRSQQRMFIFASYRRAPKRSINRCMVCGDDNVSHCERHVLQHHLKKHVFLCPYCKYGSTYAVNAVQTHIRGKHPNFFGVPTDARRHYSSEINALYRACFGVSKHSAFAA